MTRRRRARRTREAAELGGAVRRFGRALVRRAGTGEMDAVVELRALRREIDVMYRQAIAAAVESPAGYSYGDVARELRVSVQAVHKAGHPYTTTSRESA